MTAKERKDRDASIRFGTTHSLWSPKVWGVGVFGRYTWRESLVPKVRAGRRLLLVDTGETRRNMIWGEMILHLDEESTS